MRPQINTPAILEALKSNPATSGKALEIFEAVKSLSTHWITNSHCHTVISVVEHVAEESGNVNSIQELCSLAESLKSHNVNLSYGLKLTDWR